MKRSYLYILIIASTFQFIETEASEWSLINLLAKQLESTDKKVFELSQALSVNNQELLETKKELQETKTELEQVKQTCSGQETLPDIKSFSRVHSSIMRGFAKEKINLQKMKAYIAEEMTRLDTDVTSFKNDVINEEIAQLNTSLQIQWNHLNDKLTRLDRMIGDHRETNSRQGQQLSSLTRDLKNLAGNFESLNNSLNSHLSTYMHTIDTAVENRERCQSGNLYVLEGLKFDARSVEFSPSFKNVPVVTIGISYIDTDRKDNTRIKVEIDRVYRSGFRFYAKTWAGSHVYSLEVRWMACPT